MARLPSKENPSVSDVTLRTLAAQADGPKTKPMGSSSSHLSPENPLLGSMIVHDIPCTNRFLPLGSQDQAHEQGSPTLSPRSISQHPIVAHSQEELVALIIGLKEEVREMKSIMTEALTIFRSNSLARDIAPMHKEEPINTIQTSVKQANARKRATLALLAVLIRATENRKLVLSDYLVRRVTNVFHPLLDPVQKWCGNLLLCKLLSNLY
ncbi:hypothetical protein NDU88_002341 [Pleurodeles waltl]|uniref:Uncharacterized protein n=1 Tax=Pleurodeles waltl TaxID=8319 RepID=A0AAV7MMV7_PLEWA|nr:hypothetical protein NDU88_002341 [Pleurodeles waltl]